MTLLSGLQKYAKAVVAVAGFVIVVATQVADGHIDSEAIIAAGAALLAALGVYSVPNK